MTARLLAFLSRDWAGLAIALAMLLLGGGVAAATAGSVRVIAIVVTAVALLLGIGALRHLADRVRVRRACPPPGRLVDVGGFRLHVLAEGPHDAGPPLVWFGGGHASGAAMYYLHAAFRPKRRSILVDRPGSGWSDAGPFPRSTMREAAEIIAALDAAGESGPFILVGYSFGGLLAANIARRRPDLVAQLVLFDATPLDTIVYGPRLGALKQMRRDMLGTALLRLFGYRGHLSYRRARGNAAHAEAMTRAAALNGEAHVANEAAERVSKSDLAAYSIFRELSPEGVAAAGWETVVYDGDLGDLPLVLVAPGDANEVVSEPEIAGASSSESRRMLRFFALSRERYMAASSNSRRIATPAGTTHQFVTEVPDFVINLIESLISSSV
ncbi:MAG TPA: alpha/beta hydrolase [Sphingomonas sp.]|nr:alpha/beta hydrolase [Sphingomonas sp.]